MNIQEDFEEFLKLLNKKKVEYLIVGGYEKASGRPRDIADVEELKRVKK
jgi:hypothetical protein